MYFKTLLFTLTSLTLTHLATTSPVEAAGAAVAGTITTPPPPGKTYITSHPACSIPGYTVVPGNYTETIHQSSNATLSTCINSCRNAWPKCKSMAFHARYEECLWFDKEVKGIQLYGDEESEFVHWDLICGVPVC